MPLYISAHTTACLTKQSLRELMERLLESKEVKFHRVLAGQIAGRMLAEAEAADQTTLAKFFEARNINCEWIMRVDLDARDGSVVEY